MEHLEKEMEDATTSATCTSDNDALVKALGKKDYGGYVRTLGRASVGVGHRAAFGKVTQRGAPDASQAEFKSLKETIAILESKIKHIYSAMGSHGRFMTSHADVEVVSLVCVSHEKKASEQGPCKYRLAVNDDDGILMIVVNGTYHPTSTGVIFSTTISDHFWVSIDMPYDDHVNVKLHVPNDDGMTILGDAKGYFVSWPTSMVLFEERIDDEPRTLSLQCIMLQDNINDGEMDTVIVPFHASLLYEEEDKDVWVTVDEVNELLGLDCIGPG